MNHYDIAIIGLGCIGLSSSWYLSKQGMKVIGFEQYPNSGASGSCSYGDGRIWRRLQPEKEIEAEMLKAEKLFGEVERETGQEILVRSGFACIGEIGDKTYEKYKSTASKDTVFMNSEELM